MHEPVRDILHSNHDGSHAKRGELRKTQTASYPEPWSPGKTVSLGKQGHAPALSSESESIGWMVFFSKGLS